jgi:hypothetical protein
MILPLEAELPMRKMEESDHGDYNAGNEAL